MSAQGEDRSAYQIVGPWGGNDFVFMKATEGLTLEDPHFAANWANAKAEGKIRGAYHFFHPSMAVLPQIAFFLSVVASHGILAGDMLALDQELWLSATGSEVADPAAPHRAALPLAEAGHQMASSASLNGVVAEALGALYAFALTHNPVIIYTFGSMLASIPSAAGYELWIADPASAWPSTGSFHKNPFWQYQFGGGLGGGDKDAYNGTAAELRGWHAHYLPKVTTTQPGTVKASARFTNATISWSGAKNASGYWVSLIDAVSGKHLQHVAVGPDVSSYEFRHLKLLHRYELGVWARPGAEGQSTQYVTVHTK